MPRIGETKGDKHIINILYSLLFSQIASYGNVVYMVTITKIRGFVVL